MRTVTKFNYCDRMNANNRNKFNAISAYILISVASVAYFMVLILVAWNLE